VRESLEKNSTGCSVNWEIWGEGTSMETLCIGDGRPGTVGAKDKLDLPHSTGNNGNNVQVRPLTNPPIDCK
jgi:hypothetical protein